jgi:pimeloyl-ACP methyl ester carboxylesterase
MEVRTFGDGDDPDLVFVLGWGNRIDHENVRWLVDALAERYRVHAVQIPVNPTDFEADYLAPVREYVADLGEYRFLGHSTGGLIGAYLREPAPLTRTYLSPWWGFAEEQAGTLLDLITKLPTARQFVPTGTSNRESLGALATDRQIADSPDRASPAFLGVAKGAQAGLPPFDADAVVFYTPDDLVVDPEAIEARAPERNRVAYEGGHELFSSPTREDHLDAVLAAVEGGVEAIR